MSYLRKQIPAPSESLLEVNAGTWVLANLANSDNLITYVFPSGSRERYELVRTEVTVTVPVTTGSKAATVTATRTRGGATSNLGCVLALTSAALTPEGASVRATVTGSAADREFVSGDTFKLAVSSVTAFVEGEAAVKALFRRRPY